MLDNADRQIAFEAVYESEELAQQAVEFFAQKQNRSETEPCEFKAKLHKLQKGF